MKLAFKSLETSNTINAVIVAVLITWSAFGAIVVHAALN